MEHNTLATAGPEPPTLWSSIQRRIHNIRRHLPGILVKSIILYMQWVHVCQLCLHYLFFLRYPDDKGTYGIDRQFLWGPALLISPVLEEAKTSLLAIFPKGTWYDFYNVSVKGVPYNGTLILSTFFHFLFIPVGKIFWGKWQENSNFSGARDRSQDLSHARQVSEPLHQGDGLANPKNLILGYAREWREQIDPATMHHTRGDFMS